MNDPVDNLLVRLEGVKSNGLEKWVAKCPAHEDRDPSLSVARGDDGRVLLKCWAGCNALDVVQALGIELKDLFVREARRHQSPSRKRLYPDLKKTLQLARHEIWVLILFASDLKNGNAPSDEDFAIMHRAFANLTRIMETGNVGT